MTIRSPDATDAASIARVHVDAWRETYSRLLPARFFDDAAFERLRVMWNKLLASESPRRTIRVAEAGGRIVGFGCAWVPHGGSESDGSTSSDGTSGDSGCGTFELGMLYLLTGHHGSGLGQDLLNGVIGDRPASLWMAADNPRALAFYRRNRFEPNGEHRLDESFDNLPEIRLTRPSAVYRGIGNKTARSGVQ